MKTPKIITGLLFLLTLSFFSSCAKFDRPAELSIDAQNLEFDNSILERKFNVMNMGDELLTVEAYSNKDWVSVHGSGVSLSHAQTGVITVQIHTEFFQEYGVYTGYLYVQSNGGDFVLPIQVYYSQPAEPVLALDLNYLKFSKNTNQDYFTIYNDGSVNMNFVLQTEANWIQLSKNSGIISPNSEQKININVNRAGINAGVYSAEIAINTNGGNAVLDIDMDVAVYSITFFNPVYTDIQIHSSGFDPVVIESGGRHSFLFSDNPLSFSYKASTSGITSDGKKLGVEIIWDEIIDLTNYDSPTFNLNVNSDYFFMAVKNTGNYNLEMWSINYGNAYQKDEDFYIPNDGLEYEVAYYDAFEDTDIYARLSGTSNDVKWSQGVEFVLPWVENQYILLENNFKKSAISRSGLKASDVQQYLQARFIKPISKSKGSIDLYNKK